MKTPETDFRKKFKLPDPAIKPMIIFTPEAFAKTVHVIMDYDTEVAWHYLVTREDNTYTVTDVLVYPQLVSPVSVTTDMNKYALWKIGLTDEQDANLFGQAHSHVNMAVFPSGVDINQQEEEIELKGNKGFYLFQIWNKKLDVNTFLYDLDNNILYNQQDVNVVIQGSEGLLSDWVKSTRSQVLSYVSEAGMKNRMIDNWKPDKLWDDYAPFYEQEDYEF